MGYQVIDEELKAQLDNCKSPEDNLALAQEQGCELTDEQVDQISGGGWFDDDDSVVTCPSCGKKFENPHHYVTMSCPHCHTCIGPA